MTKPKCHRIFMRIPMGTNKDLLPKMNSQEERHKDFYLHSHNIELWSACSFHQDCTWVKCSILLGGQAAEVMWWSGSREREQRCQHKNTTVEPASPVSSITIKAQRRYIAIATRRSLTQLGSHCVAKASNRESRYSAPNENSLATCDTQHHSM